jgi:hypothetical protein
VVTTSKKTATESKRANLTAVVSGAIANLPSESLRAESGKWHWAFMKLRDQHKKDFPELSQLEFSRPAGVWPISERLERIFQVIDMAGSASTLNPTLVERQFSLAQKAGLKQTWADSLKEREPALLELGRELQELLKHAPTIPTGE